MEQTNGERTSCDQALLSTEEQCILSDLLIISPLLSGLEESQ